MLFTDIKLWLESENFTPRITEEGYMRVFKAGQVGMWEILIRSVSNDKVTGSCHFKPQSSRLRDTSFNFTIESLETFKWLFNTELRNEEWCKYL
jgi:hypothetical protein